MRGKNEENLDHARQKKKPQGKGAVPLKNSKTRKKGTVDGRRNLNLDIGEKVERDKDPPPGRATRRGSREKVRKGRAAQLRQSGEQNGKADGN